jgi:hypothetical protein
MFDSESFMIGVLVGLFLFGLMGKIAFAIACRRENPYAPI